MCNICGCGDANQHAHHHHDHHHDHSHNHSQNHSHHHAEGLLHFGNNPAGVSVAGVESGRLIDLQTSLMTSNNRYADQVRSRLAEQRCRALNLLSSPGSGKTELLVKTLQQLLPTTPCQVIEGDQQTSNDAERIRTTGASALQVNTGKGCHLDAHMVLHALEQQPPLQDGLLFIENVGNLVCPAGFDLGEQHKVVILSVTEGEDKPLKYPDAFYHADLMIISKIDLLPLLDFDLEQCKTYARQINPEIEILELSAKSGEGMDRWLTWLGRL